jgi:hypothetical protein
MATKAKAAKAVNEPAPASAPVEQAPRSPLTVKASVTMEITDETATYYMNAVEVGQSFSEFSLLFGKVPAKLNAAQQARIQETGTVEIPAVLQLLIPPLMLPGLLYALNAERKKYEDLHGMKLPEFTPMMESKDGH